MDSILMPATWPRNCSGRSSEPAANRRSIARFPGLRTSRRTGVRPSNRAIRRAVSYITRSPIPTCLRRPPDLDRAEGARAARQGRGYPRPGTLAGPLERPRPLSRAARRCERVPGRPQVIFTPGHTHGHCSLLFADRGALIVGDAFVMLDPYTGRQGPCVVAGAPSALRKARKTNSIDANIRAVQSDHRRCSRGSVQCRRTRQRGFFGISRIGRTWTS